MPVSNSTSKPITTDKQLSALRGAGREYEVRVADCPGLRVRVSPHSKVTWFHRYISPVTKRTVKHTLGIYLRPRPGSGVRGMGLADARDRWHQNHALILQGLDPKQQTKQQAHAAQQQAQYKAARSEFTVAAMVKLYIDALADKKSWRDVERILNRGLVDDYGAVPAHDLKKYDVRDALDKLRDQHKDVAANRLLSAVRATYNWCIENDQPRSMPIEFNPCTGIKPSLEKPCERVLNDSELRQALSDLPTSMDSQYGDLVLFTLATGCRIGEAVAMKWTDLFDGIEWRLTDTKNGEDHIVFLSPYAQRLLGKYAAAVQNRDRMPAGYGPFVWQNPRSNTGHVSPREVATRVKRYVESSDIRPFTPHDLRRTFATWMGRNGVDERVIDRCLNHTAGGRTAIGRVYNRARYDGEARDWWNNWGDHLHGLSSPNVRAMKASA